MTSSELKYTLTSANKLMAECLSTIGIIRKKLSLVSILVLGLVLAASAIVSTPAAIAQTTSSPDTAKKDIFKVIMTVQGLNHNTGDVVTIVSVNGESRVKLFDDSKTYVHSINAAGAGGIVEYVATFPNTTVKTGDVYKACALIIRDSNLICETGTNSPALRPEFKDLYLQEEGMPATSSSQAAKVSDEE
jgi:hypothetical protein